MIDIYLYIYISIYLHDRHMQSFGLVLTRHIMQSFGLEATCQVPLIEAVTLTAVADLRQSDPLVRERERESLNPKP